MCGRRQKQSPRDYMNQPPTNEEPLQSEFSLHRTRPAISGQGCSPRGVLGFLDPSPVSPRPPLSRGASARRADGRLAAGSPRWVRGCARWRRFAPVLQQILPRQAFARITITGAIRDRCQRRRGRRTKNAGHGDGRHTQRPGRHWRLAVDTDAVERRE